MRARVYDAETSVKNRGENAIGNQWSAPWHPQNQLVCEGWMDSGNVSSLTLGSIPEGNFDLLVGHNIQGFDLHYLKRYRPLMREWLKTGKIWDTMIAEFVLTGQQKQFADLNDLAVKAGGTLKNDVVKAFWEQGKDTEEIPDDILHRYQLDDVENTDLVYRKQRAQAEKLGLLRVIEADMEAALATSEMEYNGMAVDMGFLNERIQDLYEQRYFIESFVKKDMEDLLPVQVKHLANPTSNQILSYILFGGSVNYEDTVTLPEKFKTGERAGQYKTKKITKAMVWTGAYFSRFLTTKTLQGWYQVNDEVLEAVCDASESQHMMSDAVYWETDDDAGDKEHFVRGKTLAANVLKLRRLDKELKTYFEGYKKLCWPDRQRGIGIIHHSLNHTVAVTGRLSCSKPNLQNADKESDVRRAFISRWKDEGVLLEVDLSQIEVVCQALLSGDTAMKQDVRNGIDFHCKRLAFAEGKAYGTVYDLAKVRHDPDWEKKRTDVKEFSFQRSYGAGPIAIARNIGIPDSRVRAFIEAENEAYPEILNWQQRCSREVNNSRKPSSRRTRDGLPAGIGYLKSITGRRYVFYEYDSPDFLKKRGVLTNFKPTQIKNYPVQGLAGEVLKVLLRELYREFVHWDTVKLVNTVHDSVVLDLKKENIDEVVKITTSIIKRLPEDVSEAYDIDFDLPIRCDIKVGANWFDMEEIQ